MKRTHRLKRLYPSMINFFIIILGCPNAEFEHVAREALMIDETDNLRDINDLFGAMSLRLPSQHLLTPSQVEALSLLRQARIFPTRRGLENTGAYHLSTAGDEHEWFIPDDPRSSFVFAEQLSFLVLDKKLFVFKTFFELLGLRHRFLSVAARCEAVVDDQAWTGGHLYGRWLRKRIRFVIA